MTETFTYKTSVRAFISLACLMAASCASVPQGQETRIVFGRIISTPTADLWLGHVTADGVVIYEVVLEDRRNTLTGFIPRPDSRCPYNSRPREQLFRIEYGVSRDLVVYQEPDMRPHLLTRNVIVKCELAASGEATLR